MKPQFSGFLSPLSVLSATLPHRARYYDLSQPSITRFLASLYASKTKPVAITCAGKTDGGGAQVHAVLSVIAFCRAFDIPFVYTPFYRMEHTDKPSDLVDWNDAFDLGHGLAQTSDIGLPIVRALDFFRDRRAWKTDCVVSIDYCHPFTDLYPATLQATEDHLRASFNLSRIEKPHPELVSVAVHVRRGDVTSTAHADRFTSLATIKSRMQNVRSTLGDRPARFTVYSQGQPEDFSALVDIGCDLALNTPPLETIGRLAASDVLLTAKSSFSYVAGMLNTGVVLYETFWHSKLPRWHDVDDQDSLELALDHLRRCA